MGDTVTAGGVSGTVKAISVFNTELATADNQQVLIPNSSIMSNIITNITANPTRRIDLLVSIGYGDNIAKARETLTRLLKEDSRILPEPPGHRRARAGRHQHQPGGAALGEHPGLLGRSF